MRVRTMEILCAAVVFLSFAAHSKSQVVTQQTNVFSASAQPAGDTGVTLGSGVTFQASNEGLAVVPSDNGVPVGIRPGLTAVSPLIFDSTSATMNISTQAANISTYVTDYTEYLNSGGAFDLSKALTGSKLQNISTSSPEGTSNISSVTTTLVPDKQYVLVIGDASDLTNATYKLTSAGTKTLPSGVVVRATLSPGNLALLTHFTSTGTASLDLQVQQRNANENDAVTFFATDQEAAIQILQSSNLFSGRSSSTPPSSSRRRAILQANGSGSGGQNAGIVRAAGLGGSNFPGIDFSGGSPRRGVFDTRSTHSAITGGDSSSSTEIEPNTGITVPVGRAANVQIYPSATTGQLYLFAYFNTPSGEINYNPPQPNDPTVEVVAYCTIYEEVLPPARYRLLDEPVGTLPNAPPSVSPSPRGETPPSGTNSVLPTPGGQSTVPNQPTVTATPITTLPTEPATTAPPNEPTPPPPTEPVSPPPIEPPVEPPVVPPVVPPVEPPPEPPVVPPISPNISPPVVPPISPNVSPPIVPPVSLPPNP